MTHGHRSLLIAATLLLLLGLAPPACGQESGDFYRQQCYGCHTIGGGVLTGPDLRNVEDRKDREWLIRFILDPAAVIATGDAYAKKILADHNNVPMPKVAGMTRDRARRLLDLIAVESKLERSQFAGLNISDRPLTDEDVALGRELFTGRRRLKNGGPSCTSCHSIAGLSGLGGGLLGPDLSHAYAASNGRKAMSAWLMNPATETMAPVYRTNPIDEDEVLPLLAFLKSTAESGAEPAPGPGVEFLVLGVLGAAAALLVCDVLWRRRFTSVRAKLVGERR